jgi:hypothetical protein
MYWLRATQFFLAMLDGLGLLLHRFVAILLLHGACSPLVVFVKCRSD